MYGYGHNWGMMGGGFGGLGGFNMALWLLVARAARWRRVLVHAVLALDGLGVRPAARPGVLNPLEQRYARGEVNREEYLQKKSDLQA